MNSRLGVFVIRALVALVVIIVSATALLAAGAWKLNQKTVTTVQTGPYVVVGGHRQQLPQTDEPCRQNPIECVEVSVQAGSEVRIGGVDTPVGLSSPDGVELKAARREGKLWALTVPAGAHGTILVTNEDQVWALRVA